MHNFKAAYINELYKMSKKKKINVAIVFCIAVIAIGAIISCTVSNFMGINLTGKSEFAIMILPVFINVVIPLFTVFVCIDMFCGEYAANTVKTTLLTPASRIKIYLAKVCSAITFIAAMLIFTMVVSFIVSIPIRHTEYNVVKIIATYVISLFPLVSVCLVAVLVSNITKGSGASFMLCVIVFLVFKALELFNPSYSTLFFTSGLNMYILLNAPLISFAKIFRLLVVAIGYSIMLFSIGFLIFDKKEI